MNKKVLSISAVLLAVVIILLIIDSTLDRPVVTNKIIKAIYPDWDPEKKQGQKDDEAAAQQAEEDLSASEQTAENASDANDVPSYAESRTPMMQAVMKGDEKKLAELINSGSADINKQDMLGFTALNLAVYMGKGQAVKTLLIGGANPNISDIDGMTPTAHASRQKRLSLAKLLLERGANPNKPNNEGQTPLMIAAHYGHEDLAELLLHNNADINTKDKLGRTALIEASANGYTNIVLSLLSLGADKTARDNAGQTAQDYAFRFGHEDVAEILSGQQAQEGTVVGEPMPETPADNTAPAQPLLNQTVPQTAAGSAQAQPAPQQNQQPAQFRSNLQ